MKKIRIFLLVTLCLMLLSDSAYSFWIWSPKTKKWINPVYRVFDTPQQQFDWAKGYFDDKDYDKAIFEFKKVLKNFPKSEYAPEAKFFIALSLEQMKKYLAAYKEYQELITIYPMTERLEETIEHEYLIGEVFFKKKNYEKAQEIFAKVLVNAPYGKISDRAQFNVAMCLLKLKDYINAKPEFEKLIEDYGFSPYVDDASYNIGFCSYKISSSVKDYDEGLMDKAISDLEYFLRRYQTSEYVPKAESLLNKLKNKKAEKLFRVGAFYEKNHKNSAALKYYEELLYTYGDSDWAKKAKNRAERLKKKMAVKK